MSLAETMSSDGIRRKKINVKDVRVNDLNFYDKDIVESMALSIEDKGQLTSAIVFAENGEDGKKYTLYDGETRYLAVCKLMEENKHDGSFDVIIRPKLDNDSDIEDLLMDANLQRTKSKDERLQEIERANKLYDLYKGKNKIPTGTKRRDWIGQKIGISGRQVQNYLSEGELSAVSITSSGTSDTTRELCVSDVAKAIKRCFKTIEKAQNMADEVGVSNRYSEKIADVYELLSDLVGFIEN